MITCAGNVSNVSRDAMIVQASCNLLDMQFLDYPTSTAHSSTAAKTGKEMHEQITREYVKNMNKKTGSGKGKVREKEEKAEEARTNKCKSVILLE